MEIQIIRIKGDMEQSKTRHPVLLKRNVLFRDIIGRVARRALEIISEELIRIEDREIAADPSRCGCYYRRTHGLPCACELILTWSNENGGAILLSDIHDFWKKLDIELIRPSEDPSFPTEDDFQQLFKELVNSPPPLRRSLFKTMKEGLSPQEVDIYEPPHDESGPRKSFSSRIRSGFEYTAKMFGASPATGKGSRCSFIASSQGSPMSGISKGTPTSPPTTPTASQTSPMSSGYTGTPGTPASSKGSQMSYKYTGARTGTQSGSQGTPTSRPPRSPSTQGSRASGSGRGRGKGRLQPQDQTTGILSSRYAALLIRFIVPEIRDFVDVISDGNCGYRVVALHVYGDEKYWLQVRMDCFLELRHRPALYDNVISSDTGVLADKIAHWTDGPCTRYHWFEMPDIGHIVATRYNIVVVSYSSLGALTTMPVIVDPGVGLPEPTPLVMGHVGPHFILLHMKEDKFPMPFPALNWEPAHDPSASH